MTRSGPTAPRLLRLSKTAARKPSDMYLNAQSKLPQTDYNFFILKQSSFKQPPQSEEKILRLIILKIVMSRCESLNLLFNIFIVCYSFVHFAVGGQYIQARVQILQFINTNYPEPALNHLATYFSFLTMAGALTLLFSLYCLLAEPCCGVSTTILKSEFALTVLNLCLQMAMGVRSGINLVVFQDTFGNQLQNNSFLWQVNLQLEIMMETFLEFCVILPIMAALMWELSRRMLEQRQQDARRDIWAGMEGVDGRKEAK